MVDVIPLKNGTMFKKVFGKPDVFTAFVEDVIGIKLNITEVKTEYRYERSPGFVNTTLDLFAEDPDQRVIVEIQHVKEEDFFDRFLYYHIASLAEQVIHHSDYAFTRAVYTIVVLTSVPRDETVTFSYAVSDMSPIDETGETVPLYPHRLVFLTPRNVNAQTPAAVKAWLELIVDSLDFKVDANQHPRPLFQEMIEQMRDLYTDPEVLSEIKDDAAWERAKLRFHHEGRKEGLTESFQAGQAALIRKMKARGLTATEISDLIDAPIADVQAVLSESG